MDNFVFHNPTKIFFGAGEIKKLQRELPRGATVLLVYGGGSVKHNGVYEQVQAALGNHRVVEFAGIEPNPQYTTLVRAAELAKAEQASFILAVGGGSVIDGAKFIAAAACYSGAEPWDLLKGKVMLRDALPLGAVLTLPATGSESNMGTVISRAETGDKLHMTHPLFFPRFAVLDPTTTFSLPPRQSANGVVDAFVHVLEQYLTVPTNAAVQDRFAEGLLLTLLENGPKLATSPEDYDVRANIMWAANLALNTLIGCGVTHDWSTHMIGHELTALYGLDHARSLAVVMPAMLKARQQGKRARLLQYAERVWGLNEGDEAQRIEAAIAHTVAFFEQIDVPTRLSAHQIDADEASERVVENLLRHGYGALGEDGSVTPEVVREVLQLAR